MWENEQKQRGPEMGRKTKWLSEEGEQEGKEEKGKKTSWTYDTRECIMERMSQRELHFEELDAE